MNVVRISDINVVNPTPEQLLTLLQAEVVQKEGTAKGFYYKTGVMGPFKAHGGEIYYQVQLYGKYYGHTAFGKLESIN